MDSDQINPSDNSDNVRRVRLNLNSYTTIERIASRFSITQPEVVEAAVTMLDNVSKKSFNQDHLQSIKLDQLLVCQLHELSDACRELSEVLVLTLSGAGQAVLALGQEARAMQGQRFHSHEAYQASKGGQA